ncbi:cytochrome c oxidase subunit 3 [Reichenbachiella versicolor]|uniref:cytochrome c oxidase subunit 3 n=1 Tax=Reichenbachiella versicolor TaxID=1821036 RepID=UPI000D6DD485|nr:cytochrome c oxidase subunit 3 [Reichenbachiella versicolor]
MDTAFPLKRKDKGTSFKLHPQKVALWLFLVSVFMLFAAWTSAYVVKQSDGTIPDLEIPLMFDYSTIVVVLSSVTMHMAYIFSKRNQILNIKISLLATALLGVTFLVMQCMAAVEFTNAGGYWVGHPMSSFVYVLAGAHGVHLVSAIIFLVIVVNAAFRYRVHSKSMVRIEMCTTYWHFLGGLWMYLYLFLTLNH